jgi:transposase
VILGRRVHPEQSFRSCRGVISLAKRYGDDRLEAACARAILIKGISYRSIKATLENDLDKTPLITQPDLPLVTHENVRGTQYYH